MSELSDICDKVLAHTRAILKLTQEPTPSVSDIAEQIRARTELFTNLENSQDDNRVQLLTQLAKNLAPLDATIFEWMRDHQSSLAASLQKVKNGSHKQSSLSAEPRILVQSA